ncbi:MAG: M28 family metallopeptidase [Marinilabiliales bacterium]|nr:M28 family metallopeptidase [Marinilabiliales bacterium]
MRYLPFFCLLLLSRTVFAQQMGEKMITTDRIAHHVAVLAADSMLGRMPATAAENKVTAYLAAQMKEIGLLPAAHGRYDQEVPLLAVTSTLSPTMDFQTPSGLLRIPKMTDYVTFSRKVVNELSLDRSELVFAGFGITAPEYGRDDFKGMDLKGKTILVFVNDPGYGTQDSYFKGNTMTYYGRWTYKFEEAARQGAKGCLIIHETGPAGYPWKVVSNNGETTKLYLRPEDGYRNRCDVEGWISPEAAEKLMQSCNLSLKKAKEMALKRDFRPFALPIKVSCQIHNHFAYQQSHNVCGLIKGSKHPEEVVVYTAHWDHLGVTKPVRGDSICNGATDNASAVAWMLEISRAFKNTSPPDRSILFLAVTCEESGLLGSTYYTEHPFFPMRNTVCVINTDVMLFLGKFRDVTLTGSGQSELDDWVAAEAKRCGRYIAPDPNPDNGMFFRSDQFPFAKMGVPAIFAKGYTDAEKLGKSETLARIERYWKETYHTPQDEYHPDRDDLNGLTEDARLMFRVGSNLANSDQWPKWNKDSEFRAIRQKEGR